MASTPPTLPEFRRLLSERSVSASQLARDCGANQTSLHNTMTGKVRTPWIRRELAKRLDMTYLELWGEEDPGVDRLPRGTKKKAQTPGPNTTSTASTAGSDGPR